MPITDPGVRDRPHRKTSSRGQHRRQLLLDAAAELVLESGFAAVSHRSVAGRAKLPLSATTYYFTSLEDLVREAVSALVEGWLAGVRLVVADCPARIRGVPQVADALLRVAAFVPAQGETAILQSTLTLYERYLEAARHPHLRPVIVRYDEQLDVLLAEVMRRGGLPHSPQTARLVLAVIDGALLRALAEGAPVSSASEPLQDLLRALARPEPESALDGPVR